MIVQYEAYPFTPQLGWSISRYEVFDKCKRLYFYSYYGKHTPNVPLYKMQALKSLTSVPLEVGNVVHDVMEAFLRRLQKSDREINEENFYRFAQKKAAEYFTHKTFIELYYNQTSALDMVAVEEKIRKCLANFLSSPIFHWLFMKALLNRDNWMIEPKGYGETRLNGLKAYCKMDFLFPVDDQIYILDWKTGKKDTYKHGRQLIGYAVAASHNFQVPWSIIFPKIVYLFPEFEELEIRLKKEDLDAFMAEAADQTREMRGFCVNADENIPKPIEAFPLTPSPALCRCCNYQELCFPKKENGAEALSFDSE
jgi:hypothetical protein